MRFYREKIEGCSWNNIISPSVSWNWIWLNLLSHQFSYNFHFALSKIKHSIQWINNHSLQISIREGFAFLFCITRNVCLCFISCYSEIRTRVQAVDGWGKEYLQDRNCWPFETEWFQFGTPQGPQVSLKWWFIGNPLLLYALWSGRIRCILLGCDFELWRE